MRIRERILLGVSGLVLAIAGAQQLVHAISNGLPAAAHHAGAAASTAYTCGYITGYEAAVVIKLVCGFALLAWSLRDIMRQRTARAVNPPRRPQGRW